MYHVVMTDEQRWLSRRYIMYKAFTNIWFLGAVWLYFYRLFMTDQQVGVLDGMAFAIGMLAEVPSGALADKFGRDRIVRSGHIALGLGLIVQAASSSFLPIFIGQTIVVVGLSLVSGADDALFYDRLKFDRASHTWRKLVTRGSQVALIGTMFANTIGSWLHTMNPRIPWYLTGIAFFIAAILIWPIKDTRERSARQKLLPEIKSYLADIRTGFAEFRLPKLWIYVPIIIAVQGIFYATGYGLLRLVLLDRFNFSPILGGVAIASSSLITVGLLAWMHKHAERLSEKQVLTAISLAGAASLLLATADIGLWGYLVILTLYAAEHVLHPFMSEVLNIHASESHRATVLSVASFLRILPYIALAPLIGALNTNDKLEYFLISWATLIVFALVLYRMSKKQDKQIKISSVS